MSNRNLNRAQELKYDEFYTKMSDIEKEMEYYKDDLKGKRIYMNSDHPLKSNFWKYMFMNFFHLELKKITATFLGRDEKPFLIEYDGLNLNLIDLDNDGDFRNEKNVKFIKKSDIVITNPPFSLFREFMKLINNYNKDFIIIGNLNAVTYNGIFELIRDEKIFVGHNTVNEFIIPNDAPVASNQRIDDKGIRYQKFGNIIWYSSFRTNKDYLNLDLKENFDPKKYPKYDNYDAIEISKVDVMPKDYTELMGVPISYILRHNYKDYKILGSNRGVNQDPNGVFGKSSYLNGKETYKRLFIKKVI